MPFPFCQTTQLDILLENDVALAFFDKYPVQKGHLLIIPKKHKATYFDATPEEIIVIHQLIEQGKALIDEQYQPDGYNIGVNIGEYGWSDD
ncbi:HIT family protein [Gracilibacillus thailandensis]|uniref:HIT family protein n=1 Tax=Gracilibacillus thailandensis TaxID=563735 RepID=UPI001E620783|nr:HIT domain-containing protein [Gracilibacillus thailandensis]